MTALENEQADDIVMIDMTLRSYITDYMIIASGRSVRHIASMTKNLTDYLHHIGIRNVSIEGMPYCEWVLIDASDVVIHLFRPTVRQFYNLEKFWRLNAQDYPPLSE